MNFKASFNGLFRKRPVLSTSPSCDSDIESPVSEKPVAKTTVTVSQPSVSKVSAPTENKVSTQRPAPSTPSPRGHA